MAFYIFFINLYCSLLVALGADAGDFSCYTLTLILNALRRI